MRRYRIKEPVVVLDRFTMKEVGRYKNISTAAKDLELNRSSIRHAAVQCKPVYGCFWVYESMLPTFKPHPSYHIRVHGVKSSPKLEQLLSQV